MDGYRSGLEFVLDVVAVAVGGGAGDHLAEEAGEKEHDTEDDRDEREIEEGLVCDGAELQALRLVDQLGGEELELSGKSVRRG